MASFTRTHGDFKPVLNLDTGSYTSGAINLPTSAATVNPAGPKLDFFTVTLANVATDGDVAKATVDAIQGKATIAIMEFTDAGTDTLAIAVYPTGAWTTGTLDTATGGTTSASATFTN